MISKTTTEIDKDLVDWIISYDCDYSIGHHIYIAVKRAFRTSAETAKYIAFRKTFPNPCYELVFIFMNPDAPIYFNTKHKDGIKMTHAEWAESHKFRWFTERTINELVKELPHIDGDSIA